MFGISLPEFIIVIVLLVAVTKPSDIPSIARYLTKAFFKVKNVLRHAKDEVSKVSKELGIEDIKNEAEAEIKKEHDDLKKTIIIDIYGNEHEVHDVESIRGDLAKEDLHAQIEDQNKINKEKIKKKPKLHTSKKKVEKS
jgi:Sec-independent protein translocase protein TatA